MSLLGKRLVQSAQEAIKIANGDLKLPRYKMIVPSDLDIKSIRQKLKMTQGQFADGLSDCHP